KSPASRAPCRDVVASEPIATRLRFTSMSVRSATGTGAARAEKHPLTEHRKPDRMIRLFLLPLFFKEVTKSFAEVLPIFAVHSIFFRKVFFGACESEPSSI